MPSLPANFQIISGPPGCSGANCVLKDQSFFFSLAIMSGTFVTLTHLGQIIHFAIDDNPTIFCRRMFGDFRHGNFGAIALCHDARCSLYILMYIYLSTSFLVMV